MESFVLTLTGLILGFGLHFVSVIVIGPFLENQFGLKLYFEALTSNELALMGSMLCIAIFVGFFPSLKAYKTSVSDGLTPRVS
jgi:putative ABC transport system permease protein